MVDNASREIKFKHDSEQYKVIVGETGLVQLPGDQGIVVEIRTSEGGLTLEGVEVEAEKVKLFVDDFNMPVYNAEKVEPTDA